MPGSDLEPFPQAQLQFIHLAVVCFVVVAAEVEQTVQNQLGHFFVELQPVFRRLSARSINRDCDVTEVRFVRVVSRERQHIGRFIDAAKLPVELANSLVGNESNRR